MADFFRGRGGMTTPDAPAGFAEVVTPSDTREYRGSRGLYVGTGGDLAVVMVGDAAETTVTFANVPGGVVMPLRVSKVMAATSASDIIALY